MYLSKGEDAGSSTARWLTVSEFCEEYQLSAWTARRWARKGLVKFYRLPPRPRGRMFILDPCWKVIDQPISNDPIEWWCGLRQCDVAELLQITPRALRHMEAAGKANYRLVGCRKLYSISEVRRLLAQRQTGREKVTRNERQRSLLEYAKWKLGLATES
jgi:hypothetical protein